MDRRIGQVEAIADTLKNLKVDVDATVDRVATDVKVDLFAELQSGGSSFWGSLFGGIAGGLLGGAGQALVGALTSTQSAIKDAVADVASETLKSGLEKATEGITKNLTGKFDALSGVQRATDAIQRGIQAKITQMQQLVHDKFSTLDNITSTIDTVIDWKDGKNKKFNFQEGIRDLNNRITMNENRIHTLEQICIADDTSETENLTDTNKPDTLELPPPYSPPTEVVTHVTTAVDSEDIETLKTKRGKLFEGQVSLNNKVNANYRELYELILSAQNRISDINETGGGSDDSLLVKLAKFPHY